MKNDEYFKYLFRLQERGITNMFGAATYLQKAYGLDKTEAKNILLEWMENYEKIAERLQIEV
jgi:hypothetical protein